jgi:hypothetical protein
MCYILAAMDNKMKALLMTLAYQRQQELAIALNQLQQAIQMAQDPNEKQFLQQQQQGMAYMHKELSDALKVAEGA